MPCLFFLSLVLPHTKSSNQFACAQLDGKYKEYELNSDFRKNKDFPAKLLRGIIEVSLRLAIWH